MKIQNKQHWSALFDRAKKYILGLKDSDGRRLTEGSRSCAFIGFVCNIHTFKQIFKQYVEEGDMDYLITHKFCQDGLENTFGAIRKNFLKNYRIFQDFLFFFCGDWSEALLEGVGGSKNTFTI